MLSASSFPQLAFCIAVLATHVKAFWRMPCQSRSGLGRIDPICQPGMPSGHVHALHGAGNLGLSSTFDTLRNASCTSCQVLQDRSAYWTPALYFRHDNGSLELVEQVGGMVAYYLIRNETNGFSGVQGFPAGFQLIAGNTTRRTFDQPIPDPPQSDWTPSDMTQSALEQKAVGFNCLNYQEAPEGSLTRHFMPQKKFLDAHCTDGLRLELAFPSCWNGKDVTSTDFHSHMAYPDLVVNGYCPAGYPVRLVTLFYETIWNTFAFVDVPGQFVLSNGDTTGFGYHGDFVTGWDPAFLQAAVETCTNLSGMTSDCSLFKLQSLDQQNACKIPTPVILRGENPFDPGDILLGNNPITGENSILEPGPQPFSRIHQSNPKPDAIVTAKPKVESQAASTFATTLWPTKDNVVGVTRLVEHVITQTIVETKVVPGRRVRRDEQSCRHL